MLFNFIFCLTFINAHYSSSFCSSHRWNILHFIRKFGRDSFNFIHKIFIEKWSQSKYTDVNSGRAGGGILCRMLFIELHRRRDGPNFLI